MCPAPSWILQRLARVSSRCSEPAVSRIRPAQAFLPKNRRHVPENRFHNLFERMAAQVSSDYEEARRHAREKDSQRAGHEGEATWIRVLNDWGPRWPVVTRKYIVGPNGETGEIDLVILKPDYPVSLLDDPSVLVSGVAAAFSVKLTLKRPDIAEAIKQKKRLVEISSGSDATVEGALRGPFPFGLLSHSTQILGSVDDFDEGMQRVYQQVGHAGDSALIAKPSEELDALLVADQSFFSTSRLALLPGGYSKGRQAMSAFNRYGSSENRQAGAPIAHFVTWLSETLNQDDSSSLKAFEKMFGADSLSGYMNMWPLSIYPEHIQQTTSLLLNEYGNSKIV